jgi:hypothetical protein
LVDEEIGRDVDRARGLAQERKIDALEIGGRRIADFDSAVAQGLRFARVGERLEETQPREPGNHEHAPTPGLPAEKSGAEALRARFALGYTHLCSPHVPASLRRGFVPSGFERYDS